MAAPVVPDLVRLVRRRKLLLLLVLTAGILAALALGLTTSEVVSAGYPSICPFRTLTGIPCPGCGMAHGIACAAVGRLDDAVRYNLFSPLVLAGALLFWLMLLYDVLLDKDLLEKALPAVRVPCIALAMLLLCWGTWRIIASLTAPTPTGSGNRSGHYRSSAFSALSAVKGLDHRPGCASAPKPTPHHPVGRTPSG